MSDKISKKFYVELIMYLQKTYKLKQNRQTTLLLFDENMLIQQLGSILNTLNTGTPKSMASDGIGDFGITINKLHQDTVSLANKKQLILSALNKFKKEDLVNYSLNLILDISYEKNKESAKNKFQRSNSVIFKL